MDAKQGVGGMCTNNVSSVRPKNKMTKLETLLEQSFSHWKEEVINIVKAKGNPNKRIRVFPTLFKCEKR